MADSARPNPPVTEVSECSDGAESNGEMCVLQEHEPLTGLLSLIPHKVQRGLRTQVELLDLTCLDANKDFIAVGSNIAIVFLFDRQKNSVQRLKSENTEDSVSSVCLHNGLDHLVAIGYVSGAIYIFQLPSILMGHSKRLERFIVTDLHSGPVRCLAWSTNGMKLFSGDTTGCVGCTEVDFYEGQCKSSPFLIESNTEIVQLNQAHRSLLVATRHRCIICRTDDVTSLVQVGSKDRKILGDFGACFIPAMCKPEDAQLYASRPGFRIWKSTVAGTVNNTFIFKDLLSKPHPQIKLSPFDVTNIEPPTGLSHFGPLLIFRDTQLVTWSESCLYVIDPENIAIVGSQKHIGSIRSVSITEDEIFVLRTNTDRNLVRISSTPLKSSSSTILKQLKTERKEEIEDKENTIGHAEEDGTHKDKSAFKLFQGNLINKVKKISNPVLIKDKIQEKLKSKQHVSENQAASRYSQEYEFEKDTSPTRQLPPVVKLTSPTLMAVALGLEDDIIDGAEGTQFTKLDIENMSAVERFVDSTLESSQTDTESVETSTEVQSVLPQTGSGTDFVRPALQENHSRPVSGGKARNVPQFADVEDSGDIVFSQRKVKAKRNKKGAKGNRLKPVDRDQDTLSISSITSMTSDTSENVSPIKDQPDGTDDSREMDPSVQGNRSPVDPTPNVAKEVMSPLGGDDSLHVDDNRTCDSVTPPGDSSINTSGVQPEMAEENTAVGEDLATCTSKASSPEAAGQTVPADMGEKLGETAKSDLKLVMPSQNMKTMERSDYLRSSENVTGNPYMSNLDKELARLNSYLSETSEDTDTGNVTTDSPSSATSQIVIAQARREVEQILLKDTKEKYDQLEKDIVSSVKLETKDNYQENALEKQLKELENEAMGIKSDKPPSPKPTTDASQPSISNSTEKTPSSPSVDFYSQFISKSTNTLSSTSSDPLGTHLQNEDTDDSEEFEDEESDTIRIVDSPQTIVIGKSVNTWMEINATGNIHSLSVSNTHVWYTDKSYNIYYSPLRAPGLSWRKATGSASQIAVSPLGHIVWCLHKNTVFAGTKITTKRPEGMKWVEAVRDVAYISVDDTCAWYIKTGYEVMMQKGLSRERPCYTAKVIDCPFKLKQVVCRSGVVWAITDSCQWIYRHGISPVCSEGTQWKQCDSGTENHLFSCIALGDSNTGWAVDVIGRLWFCCGVTMETPRGDNAWWQVPFSGEYLMKDLSTMDILKSLTRKLDPQKLAYLLSTQRSGLVAATGGVWVCPEYKHIIHSCRGSLEGHHWIEAHPEGLASTSTWKTVIASNAVSPNGLVWAQQPNGDIFTFTTDRRTCSSVSSPRVNTVFACMSACTDALWALTDEGDVYIRTEMGERYPQGGGWCNLDLSQLDENHLVHVSCSKTNIWAVDSDGAIFHRIGVRAPSDRTLNAAWLPVDNGGTVFIQIVTGSQDWMVWAVDNRRQVYVRSGITLQMPIGRKWVHVPGTPAMRLSLSDHHVWALNMSGELLCRYGVSETNVAGDYWKKSPGLLSYVSASPSDILWGINREGQLVRRRTKYIIKQSPVEDEAPAAAAPGGRNISVCSDDADWEFV